MQVSRKLEGHPLAIRVFAAALATQADRDPTRLLNVLFDRSSMDATVPLQGKLSRLLGFYEKHMPVHRKALMRLISLFRSPIDRDTLKKLSKNLAKTKHLFDEMPDAIWRSHLLDLRNEHLILRDTSEDDEERFSCHPILRDHFRASMLSSDKTAASGVADLLTGQPASDRPSSLHEIEPVLSAIELLQQAGNFGRADELYQERLKNGLVFRFLPAPHEGLNCVFGFVADKTRQNRCTKQLGKAKLSYYLNAVGLHGAFAGELKLAVMFYDMADHVKRNELQLDKTVTGQQNKSWALVQLGRLSDALDIAYEAVLGSNQLSSTEAKIRSYVHYAYVLFMRGDVEEAEGYFGSAEELQRSSDRKRRNLVSSADIWWSEMLIRVGELARARKRLEANILVCVQNGWVDDVARCHYLIGKIALHGGDDRRAEQFLDKAEIAMVEAHMMTELPQVLVSLAIVRKRQQEWEDALLLAEESLELSRLRGMLPSHADSLILRAILTFEGARRR